MIEFVVQGTPLPQPRQRFTIISTPPVCPMCKRGRPYLRPYGNKEIKAWKETIGWEARVALRQRSSGPELFDGPLLVVMQFVFSRTSDLLWKKRPMPREPMVTKPDIDNFAVAALNALNRVVYADDNQVADLVVSKRIAAGHEKPHLRVLVAQHPVPPDAWGAIRRWDEASAPAEVIS